MKLVTFARRVLAAASLLGVGGVALAADTPVAPPATIAYPAAAAPCPTCAAPTGTPCGPTCSKSKLTIGSKKAPYQVHLCPGACFGYFQTQWSKWEDVCPLPYQGQGITDAPPVRPAVVTPVRPPSDKKPEDKKPTDKKPEEFKPVDPKGGTLPPPRPGNGTSPMPVGTLPPIPLAPSTLPLGSGKFGS